MNPLKNIYIPHLTNNFFTRLGVNTKTTNYNNNSNYKHFFNGGLIMKNANWYAESVKPEYGINYNAGYIGFTFNDTSFISEGIAYFTRWDKMTDIPVSHVLIVTSENTCVEALMGYGVVQSRLDKYFNDKNTHIFFRKPKGLDEIISKEIVSTAQEEIGAQYCNGLIVNDALRGSFLGHLIDDLAHDQIFDGLAMMLEKSGSFICSELAAYCLKSAHSWQPYNHEGVLARPAGAVTPQALFCDEYVFEQWRNVSLALR